MTSQQDVLLARAMRSFRDVTQSGLEQSSGIARDGAPYMYVHLRHCVLNMSPVTLGSTPYVYTVCTIHSSKCLFPNFVGHLFRLCNDACNHHKELSNASLYTVYRATGESTRQI